MRLAKIPAFAGLLLITFQLSAVGVVRRFAALPAGHSIADIATDAAGNVYVVGWLEPGARQGVLDTSDAFVIKLSADGSELLYRRVFSGAGGDSSNAVATGDDGAVYVALATSSRDLPGTPGALQPAFGSDGYQALLAKLNPDGAVIYATYIGGTSNTSPADVAVSAKGEAIVSGQSVGGEFPTTPDAVVAKVGGNTGFVAKLDATGSTLVFGLRGIGNGPVALHADGNLYLAGSERGGDPVPVTPGALQPTHGLRACGGAGWIGIPCSYGYVLKLNPAGTETLYGTFLTGTFGSTIAAISVGADGSVLVAGSTNSPDFPTTPGALLEDYVALKPRPPIAPTPHVPVFPPPQTGFVAQLDKNGEELIFSTFFSGTVQDSITGLRRGDGSIFVSGIAESADLPGLSAPAPCLPAAYVAEITLDGSGLLHTTLLDRWSAPRLNSQGDPLLAIIGPEVVEVDLRAPQAKITCVLEAATLARAGAVAPGSLLSLFGNGLNESTLVGEPGPDGLLPATLGSVSVLVDGRRAPLLYASPSQVNLQVPYEAEPGTEANLQLVRVEGNPAGDEPPRVRVEHRRPTVFASPLQELLCPQLQVFPVGPGVSPLALNEDGTIVACASPAKPGSVVTIFFTGIGRTDPPQTTGGSFEQPPAPLALPVSLGAAEVISASSLPGSVASVWQVRFRVPGNTGRVLRLEPEIDGVRAAPAPLFLWVDH